MNEGLRKNHKSIMETNKIRTVHSWNLIRPIIDIRRLEQMIFEESSIKLIEI